MGKQEFIEYIKSTDYQDLAISLDKIYGDIFTKVNDIGIFTLSINDFGFRLTFAITIQNNTFRNETHLLCFDVKIIQELETVLLEIGNTFADFHRHSFPEMYFKP
jgi:hypothetical protein